MKNLIYQYWDGDIKIGVRAGVAAMKKYAERIGAEYLFEENPRFVTNLGMYSPHYGAFKPIYTDSFHQYDNVLFADTDVFPVEGLSESIFDGFVAEIGICTEPFQPEHRTKMVSHINTQEDEKWAKLVEGKWKVKMPRTKNGLLKVYNSGVVLYSNAGLKKAKEKFVPFKEYVDMINKAKMPAFYTCDQPYIHAMLSITNINWIELDNEWNRYVHHYYNDVSKKEKLLADPRTPNTKFVHIQLRTADDWNAEKLWKVTNLPSKEWNL